MKKPERSARDHRRDGAAGECSPRGPDSGKAGAVPGKTPAEPGAAGPGTTRKPSEPSSPGATSARPETATPPPALATSPPAPPSPGRGAADGEPAAVRQTVVAAIIARGKQVLVARRGAPGPAGAQAGAQDTLDGYWEFPGGKVEPGESWEQALKREMREELGVEVRLTGTAPVHRVPWDYDHIRVELVALTAHITAGDPAPLDHRELRWVDADELVGLNLLPADRPIAEVIARRGSPGRRSFEP